MLVVASTGHKAKAARRRSISAAQDVLRAAECR
jgi:hypothetical protein